MTVKTVDVGGGGMPPVTPQTPQTPQTPLSAPPQQGLDTGTVGGLVGMGTAGIAKAAPYLQNVAPRMLPAAGAVAIPLAAAAAVPAVGGVIGHTLANPIADMLMPQSPLRQQLGQDASAVGAAPGFGKIPAAAALVGHGVANSLQSAWEGFGEGIQGVREAMAQRGAVGGVLSGQPTAQAGAPAQAAPQVVPGTPAHGHAALSMPREQFLQSLQGMSNHEGMQLLQAMSAIPSHGDQATAELHNLYNQQYAAELHDAKTPAEQLKAYQNHLQRLLPLAVRGIGGLSPDFRS